MKFLFAFLFCIPLCAQDITDIEIFLFDLEAEDSVKVENGRNISQNSGYDNQPSFYSEDTIIYSRTRNGQTDIGGIEISNSERFWFSDTGMGSEYSPRRLPGSEDIAAVRLDTTGLQLLYRYDTGTGESKVLLPELKVGYYFHYNEYTLVTAVLSGTGMDLVINDLENKTSQILIKNIGRSIHKVPNSKNMSYTILNDQNEHDLYLLDLEKEEPESFFLCTLPQGVQDYAWLDRDRILLGKGNQIFLYDRLGENEWIEVANLSEYGLDNITRLMISPDGKRFALAAEIDSE